MKIEEYFASIERGLRHNLQISKYLRDDRRVFRYDNAPHHPEIATHPHHKHIGPEDRLTPAEPPSLSQVFAEIEELLGQLS